MSYQKVKHKKLQKEECAKPEVMERLQTSSMDECISRLTHGLEGELLIFFIIHGLVQIHFCFVIYTHWKNSDLSKENGGVAGSQDDGTIDDT